MSPKDPTIACNEPTADPGGFTKVIERIRRTLLDTGKRNRLIHTPRSTSRGKFINIVDELSEETLRILYRENKAMKFLPIPGSDETGGDEEYEDGVYIPPPDEEGNGLADRHTDNQLQTALKSETLQKKLLSISRDAKTIEEEQGINALYLALGFLRWYERESSDVLREAPLILVPVELARDSTRSSFRLKATGEEIQTNLSLKEMLFADFGITLPDIPETEDWTVSDYLSAIEVSTASHNRWSLDSDGMQLGFFSFSKFLMYKDLDPKNWNEKLLENPIIRGLLYEGFESASPIFGSDDRLDDKLKPEDLIHVVDADASQAVVIETVRRGRSLVVKGPPGTGKSQTIANIIASSVRDGRTVLFVAEKMAALEVVHSRLQQTGLGRVCLELHSRHSNKRAIAEEIGRTLDAPPVSGSASAVAKKFGVARLALNEFSAKLHSELDPSGVTPYQAIGTQIYCRQIGHPPPDVQISGIEAWAPDAFKENQAQLSRLVDLIRTAGPSSRHPWRGVGKVNLQPADQERLLKQVSDLHANAMKISQPLNRLIPALGLSGQITFGEIPILANLLQDLSRRPEIAIEIILGLVRAEDQRKLAKFLQEGCLWQNLTEAVNTKFRAGVWELEVGPLRSAIARGNASFLSRLGAAYREARAELDSVLNEKLPKDRREHLELLDLIAESQTRRKDIERAEQFGSSIAGAKWDGTKTNFHELKSALDWIEKLKTHGLDNDIVRTIRISEKSQLCEKASDHLRNFHRKIIDGLEAITTALQLDLVTAFDIRSWDELPFAALCASTEAWLNNGNRLEEWVRLKHASEVVGQNLSVDVVGRLGDGRLPLDRAQDELSYARAEALWRHACQREPDLQSFDGAERSKLVSEFSQLDIELRSVMRNECLARYSAAVPRGSAGEMAVIRGEISKKRRHMSVRKLIGHAGLTLQRIKPVFLVSPISLAQFASPEAVKFDLLIIDEASQVKPADAIGAILRAKQIVIVGDEKQLPPTSFFDRMIGEANDEEDDALDDTPLGAAARAEEMESILTLCLARGLPAEMLEWHYRSRHPSLVEVSNAEFYDDRLFLPPSPMMRGDKVGLRKTRVNGIYDRGGKRTNEIEAKAVVAAVIQHAEHYPDQSLWVVTLSMAQRDLINNLIEAESRENHHLADFIRREGKSTLAKNLENIQGDESDVIFVSIGYGPAIANAGLESMSFGPVNSDGGERRLNVLFTRAKIRCEVFVSFDSGHIDLGRVSKRGSRILKQYLRYAETGCRDLPVATGSDFDSPFEQSVAKVIAAAGYDFDIQVGSVGFRIDIAVKNPDKAGEYLLAVECDGATYHSARWARERDRLRQAVLEDHGWNFHRIWSTDWFRRPEVEAEKLLRAIEEIRLIGSANSAEKNNPTIQEIEPPETVVEPEHEVLNLCGPDDVKIRSIYVTIPYEEANVRVHSNRQPHEASQAQMAKLVTEIVCREQPIHTEELARRIARAFNNQKAGRRTLEAVRYGLVEAKRQGSIASDGEFWHEPLEDGARVQVRDRSNASPSVQRAAMIPPSEIESAIRMALEENGSIDENELAQVVTRIFGFQRAGPELKRSIKSVLESMVSASQISLVNGRVRYS